MNSPSISLFFLSYLTLTAWLSDYKCKNINYWSQLRRLNLLLSYNLVLLWARIWFCCEYWCTSIWRHVDQLRVETHRTIYLLHQWHILWFTFSRPPISMQEWWGALKFEVQTYGLNLLLSYNLEIEVFKKKEEKKQF